MLCEQCFGDRETIIINCAYDEMYAKNRVARWRRIRQYYQYDNNDDRNRVKCTCIICVGI